MEIKAKYIRSAKRVRDLAGDSVEVKLAFKILSRSDDLLVRIGLSKIPINSGVVPSAIGPRTIRNAEGYVITRRDLPKIDKTYSVYREWSDWHDNTHSGYQDITRKAYPKEDIPPTLHKLYLIEVENDLFVTTDKLNLATVSDEVIVQLSNIMLECFGSFTFLNEDGLLITTRDIETLTWEILPSGSYPWSSSNSALKLGSKRLNTDRKVAVEHRYNSINKLLPDNIYRGYFGFNGYYVFAFEKRGVYVLESVYLNNATYVFFEDWKTLSTLTKSQIVNGDFKYQRIVHGSNWPSDIGRLLA